MNIGKTMRLEDEFPNFKRIRCLNPKARCSVSGKWLFGRMCRRSVMSLYFNDSDKYLNRPPIRFYTYMTEKQYLIYLIKSQANWDA